MTLDEIVYNLAELTQEANTPHYIERLKFNVLYYRALFLRRDHERGARIPDQFTQNVNLTMERVNQSETTSVDLDCEVYRSTEQLPQMVNLKNQLPLRYVGTIDNLISYSPINVGELPYYTSSRYTKNAPRYYVQDGYVYLVNSNAKEIHIKGIFEDPRKLHSFTNRDGYAYSDTGDFPITGDMVQRITAALLSGELQLRSDNGEEVELNE